MSREPSVVIDSRQRLVNLCRALEIPFVEDVAICIANITKKVEESRAQLPADYEGKRLWTTPLSPEDTQVAEELNEAFKEDYKARREMMLKRLDVTLQSLLWSDKGKENQEEMMQIIEHYKNEILSPGAPYHTLLDVYATQDDVIAVTKTSNNSSISGSRLAGVFVTDVVDRGGRFGEKRKAKDMPTFSARSDAAQKHSSTVPTQSVGPSSSSNKPKEQRQGSGGRGGRGGGRGGGNKRGKHN